MNRALRVVVASRIYPPEPAAASFRLQALVNALADAGAEVTVLTSAWKTARGRHRPRERVEVRRAPVLRDASGYVRGYVQYASFDMPLALRLLFAGQPDVVVCEPPPTTGSVVRLVAAIRNIPYVYYAADLWSEATGDDVAPRFVQRVLWSIEDWALRGAQAVLSVSDAVTVRLAGRGNRDSAVTVGNGIDTSIFSSEGPVQQFDGPLIVYTGTASEVHGAVIFIEALRDAIQKVPGLRFVFMGQGTDVGRMKRLSESLPSGTATFLPRQEPEVVAAWLRRADLAVASVRPGNYAYAFPSKIFAAAACGAPVLFAGEGPAVETVRKAKLGYVSRYEPTAVADAIVTALTAPPDAEGRARRARWVRDNASLAVVGCAAANAVLAAARERWGLLIDER